MRSYLSSDVYNVDKSVNDQLWFSLTSVPGVRFCGAYITPSTSTYYSEADIANLQAKSMVDAKVVIVGDLNARMGTKVNELVSDTDELNYAPMDSGENENGKKLLSILKDNKMVVVNNLSTSSRNFSSGLTFRMRKIWKSELDLCIMSRELVPTVSHMSVNQDTRLPSNHAPVSVSFCFPEKNMGLQEMVRRSGDLGMHLEAPKPNTCKRPIRFREVDLVAFIEKARQTQPPLINNERSVNDCASEFGDRLYDILSTSKLPRRETSFDLSISSR